MIWENRRRATMSRVCLRGHVLCKRQERRTGSVGGEEGKPACSLHGYVQGVYDRQSGKRPCLPYDYVIEFSREVNFLLFYPPHVVPRTWDRIRVHRLDSEEIDGHTSYPWHPNDDMQQMAQNGSFGWDYIHLPWTLAFFFLLKLEGRQAAIITDQGQGDDLMADKKEVNFLIDWSLNLENECCQQLEGDRNIHTLPQNSKTINNLKPIPNSI